MRTISLIVKAYLAYLVVIALPLTVLSCNDPLYKVKYEGDELVITLPQNHILKSTSWKSEPLELWYTTEDTITHKCYYRQYDGVGVIIFKPY